MPQLDPTWFASQLFWLAITFALLYFVLARLILPPLQDVVIRRQQVVDDNVSEAVGLKTEAQKAQADYERALAEARSRAQSRMGEAVQAIKANAEQKNKEMDREIEDKLSEATRRIVAKKEEMITALAPTATELTAMIVEKLTQQSPSNDTVKKILGELPKGRR